MPPSSFRLLPLAAAAAAAAAEPYDLVELRCANLAFRDPNPVNSFAAACAKLGCSLPILG